MKTLFDAITLGKIEVKNRLVRSATFEYGGDKEGRYQPQMDSIYETLAKGGVGLIITGMVGVDENSRVAPFMVKAYDDAFSAGLQQLVELVHRHGSKIVVQLSHCGAKVQQTDSGLPPVAASALPDKTFRELSPQDILALIDRFTEAAIRCKEAGADGIQIHAAHGYLLSQFLSPIFNRRTDAYGGSIENRATIVFDIYTSIRAAVGKDYPVWIKLNSSDLEEGGLTLEESRWICDRLSEMGIDAIEVSGGISISPDSASAQKVQSQQDEGHFYLAAQQIAQNSKADIISVGGYRTPELLEEKLGESKVKAISICRPLICEPDLVSRWKSGDLAKSKCISCNRCFAPGALSCKAFPQGYSGQQGKLDGKKGNP